MKPPTPLHGPHTHATGGIGRTMGLVMIALLPATLFGLWRFGWPAAILLAITLVTAVLAEAISLKIAGKPAGRQLLDGSAVLTGWLLALTLPPWAPWWIGAVGALLAIVIGKQVFGGIGQNLFNPAMVARVALLISFPLEMTSFVSPAPLFSAGSPGFLEALGITFGSAPAQVDAVTSASLLGHIRTETGRGIELAGALANHFEPFTQLWGDRVGSLGETSVLLLLAGGLLLLATRIITWHIPAAMLATIAALAALTHGWAPTRYPGMDVHLLSGATLLGAFFIATDLVTSPVTPRGQLLFGAGCGLLTFVIRSWTAYPEGVAFAVLLMNAVTPLIDHYLRPRVYGRDRHGAPLRSAPAESDGD